VFFTEVLTSKSLTMHVSANNCCITMETVGAMVCACTLMTGLLALECIWEWSCSGVPGKCPPGNTSAVCLISTPGVNRRFEEFVKTTTWFIKLQLGGSQRQAQSALS